ncbi:hypothetical protein [Neopusillimonas aromaticivorans]|uniref:hypothetical protein n=1 Tax=Neopusillimonas aromaticivorans TaxID=2979868 RepID=UPI0025980E15|nr:hypothetical protein [Neopusillimonas aromaticivorans]NLZ10482.1 hypothetical protein [Alcaligenaceae bacterium]WJJ93318.1 hypothetical protein N7E01_15170 [Neopusillimonas aromaticivorans]
MSDPSRIMQARLALRLGLEVRFVDWAAPGVELPEGATSHAPEPELKVKRAGRDDFCKGDRVSFEDRHLQTCIGTIVRSNRHPTRPSPLGQQAGIG